MGKFDGVLLLSDFDNTLVYTEDVLVSGGDLPPHKLIQKHKISVL